VANRSRRARTTEQVFYELFWFKEGIHMWPSLSETTWSTRSWPWSIPVPFSISAFEQGLRVLTPQPDPQSSMRLPSPPKPTPTLIDRVIATLLPFDLVLKEIRRRSRRSSSIRSIDVGRPPPTPSVILLFCSCPVSHATIDDKVNIYLFPSPALISWFICHTSIGVFGRLPRYGGQLGAIE
jgi:hypothetical protein